MNGFWTTVRGIETEIICCIWVLKMFSITSIRNNYKQTKIILEINYNISYIEKQ